MQFRFKNPERYEERISRYFCFWPRCFQNGENTVTTFYWLEYIYIPQYYCPETSGWRDTIEWRAESNKIDGLKENKRLYKIQQEK